MKYGWIVLILILCNGCVNKDTVVKIDYITSKTDNNIRVTDNIGKIWYLSKEDLDG